jgi:high-affinity iron transporter
MGNALFVVWRETIEAMLVVGILYGWLKRHDVSGRGMRFLWGGVAAGLGLAGLLAVTILGLTELLSADAFAYFQLGMVLLAAGLIVQMVLWMRSHGRKLKRELEAGMARNVETANWWGLLTVVMLAVGRESAEAVVFLYGLGMGRGDTSIWIVLPLGIVLAWFSFWLLQQGGRFVSWQRFFRISEVVLLFLASSLLVNGVAQMIALGVLPPLLDPVWSTASILDDSSRIGGVISALTGYRAQPALTMVIAYLAFWGGVTMMMRRQRRMHGRG